MTYVQGFVAAVPAGGRDAYLAYARETAKLFREYGATRCVECWGEDVPRGKLTDFWGAVQAGEGEVVVFSWVEYASREVSDAAMQKMMDDPRMAALGDMPFDGKRMIYGGFSMILDG